MTSRGYVYTHDMRVNGYCYQAFPFTTGDVLKFQYDTYMGELQVTKNMLKKVAFKIKKEDEGDCYRPCAYLWRSDEMIEITPI